LGSAAANAGLSVLTGFVAGGVSGIFPDRIWIQTPVNLSPMGPELRDQLAVRRQPTQPPNILSTLINTASVIAIHRITHRTAPLIRQGDVQAAMRSLGLTNGPGHCDRDPCSQGADGSQSAPRYQDRLGTAGLRDGYAGRGHRHLRTVPRPEAYNLIEKFKGKFQAHQPVAHADPGDT